MSIFRFALQSFDDSASLPATSDVSRPGVKLGTWNARLDAGKRQRRRQSEGNRFDFPGYQIGTGQVDEKSRVVLLRFGLQK